MSKKRMKSNGARDKPAKTRSSVGMVLGGSSWDTLCCSDYVRLSDNPEVRMAVGRIADLISTMTIHLMANTDAGDIRLKNALSRKLDIEPNRWMTRKTLMSAIIWTLLLDGGGNAVVLPRTSNGMLEDLIPIPPGRVSFAADGCGYKILIDGIPADPAEVLHFVSNPDTSRPWMGTGFRVSLQSVVKNLKQASATKNAFLSSEWKPSVIVRVDGESEQLTTAAGRKELLDRYFKSSRDGEPWMIPAELFEVTQVKPLSLNDLALSDSVKLDKQTVAAILGVPPYVVGIGTYNQQEWNHFISTTIMPLVRGIEQEMTRKLLLSPDWYISMNPWALYAYDLKDLEQIGADLYVRGIMTGNEVREWVRLGPKEGLDDLVILENYIPRGMIGDQKKLEQNGGEADGTA